MTDFFDDTEWQKGFRAGQESMEEQNKKLRDALAFYADESKWSCNRFNYMNPRDINDDGKRARQALKESE